MRLKRVSYIIFLIGLTIFMYPHVRALLFEAQNKTAFNEYENVIEHMSDEEISRYVEEFQRYNEYIANVSGDKEYYDPFIAEITQRQTTEVKEVVRKVSTSNGAFGYIEIPKIKETLPIYLGASMNNLAKGVAQIEETSLPIGGVGTNSVIAGHRGYSKGYPIFKHLDQLSIGDRFYIYVYNMTLTYEVVGIEVILPEQTEKLKIDPDKDMVTLLTCTPYRVSTHRLLVYGIRVNDGESKGEIDHEGMRRGVLSLSSTRENAESVEARNTKFLTYAIVGIGSIMWITVFILLLRTFRKQIRKA